MVLTGNKSTEHGGQDLCEVVCDRLRLLTGAVLMDEQQGGYRVCRPNLGTEASFRFRRESVKSAANHKNGIKDDWGHWEYIHC